MSDNSPTQFKILQGSFTNLEFAINKYLADGWKLRGRVRKKIGETYYQVMVK